MTTDDVTYPTVENADATGVAGPEVVTDPETVVDRILSAIGPVLVVGAPLGLGKANRILEAIYARACDDPAIDLTVHTALGLVPPRPSSELEARLRRPINERLFGTIPRPRLFEDLRDDALPPNVTVHSFYFEPGSVLSSGHARRNRINANYSDIERRLDQLGFNVFVQLVAPGDPFSLSCNPDLSLAMIDGFRRRRKAGEAVMFCGETNRHLPWMGGDAAVPLAELDVLLETEPPDYELFSTPNLPLDEVDHSIGAHAASLIADGGTLQLGIGTLSDAVTWMLCVRHHRPHEFGRLLRSLRGDWPEAEAFVDRVGGTEPFHEGLYAASEMLVHGFLELIDAGVLTREIADGHSPHVIQAGFFLGPRSMYERLRTMAENESRLVAMTGIDRVNSLDHDTERRVAQRPLSRFVNSAINVTLDGAVASDTLDDGRVVSGVGGQFDFVEMARRLPGARSVILLRAVHDKGRPTSNIVLDHRHVTCPGHLRDVVVTEYGVADLRHCSDGEVARRMIEIADSRFQPDLVAAAKGQGRLRPDYDVPEHRRNNTPDALRELWRSHTGLGPELPFDSDLTDAEVVLGKALRHLDGLQRSRDPRRIAVNALPAVLFPPRRFRPLLRHMGLERPRSWSERAQRAALAYGLAATGGLDGAPVRRPPLTTQPSEEIT
ncbi:MAG: acetyl-CoA hydrolase/transferase C-terminal domain-containing protein [Acidimicrobiales bacterium]